MSRSPLACLLVVAAALAATACAAPRDPVLEKKVWEARLAAEKAAKQAASPAPAAPAPTPAASAEPPPAKKAEAKQTEIRTYSSAEVATILGSISGTGPSIKAELVTDMGTITCRLDADKAPQTVANFVALARGTMPWRPAPRAEPVAKPFYDGLPFYRVVQNFLVEAGRPANEQISGPGWRLAPEHGGDAFFDAPGAIAMLSDAGAMHGSRFFIVVRPDASLAAKYAAFGQCQEVDLVKRIAEVEQSAKDTPKVPVLIQKVVVTRGE